MPADGHKVFHRISALFRLMTALFRDLGRPPAVGSGPGGLVRFAVLITVISEVTVKLQNSAFSKRLSLNCTLFDELIIRIKLHLRLLR